MITKKIVLYYKITDTEIFHPDPLAIQKKEEWIKANQRTISKPGEIRTIRLTYELFNPEVEDQRKFFNGPVVEYFAIQSGEIMSGELSKDIRDRYRESILSQILGYEVLLIEGKERRRTSTSEFTDTQQWHDFLERLRETLFEPEGYEMPISEEFWKLSQKYGYDRAKKISIDKLRERIKAKNTNPDDY